MQINKIKTQMTDILSDVFDGATIMVGGFGEAGSPIELLHGLIDNGAKDLTIIANNSGNGRIGLGALIGQRQVKKVICSFARSAKGITFQELYNKGEIELEVVPQGTLAERIRAAGAGVPAFYTATAVGTPLAEGKQEKTFNGKKYILEHALHADFAFVKADKADRYGNLTFNKTARNFNPVMCMAAKQSIVQVKNIIDPTQTDPEKVVTPGIFVNKIIKIINPIIESNAIEEGLIYP
ncbi:3-oxoacid CoA-transferase subunit A [Alphaproteobacteria bacterium]|nr:3-oxoacid CoA-transferase subunit A [Alphaproteobacteria bacterium]MDB9915816.1 3-oxoacid CoA-transferase subunit A [Alphaproteobacteria bacterium]|tara:strand:+ start:3734 stop:4447 length:714 start_codon:yes stop_codon:yes gene_type:complete